MIRPLLTLAAVAGLLHLSPRTPAAAAGIVLGALVAILLAMASRPGGRS